MPGNAITPTPIFSPPGVASPDGFAAPPGALCYIRWARAQYNGAMKTLILSDIHSNIYALEAIWAKEHDCDLTLCAGDLVDYGPYPREVIDWVRAHNVRCVQGNHDAWVAALYRQAARLEDVPVEERTWALLNVNTLEEADIQYLAALPKALTIHLDGVAYGVKHMYRDYEEIVSRHAFEQFCGEAFDHSTPAGVTRLILGHTHRQGIRFLSDERFWLNPGSASYRRKDDPDQSAHYATITDGWVSLKWAAYDVAPLRRFVQGAQLKESELAVANFFFGPR